MIIRQIPSNCELQHFNFTKHNNETNYDLLRLATLLTDKLNYEIFSLPPTPILQTGMTKFGCPFASISVLITSLQ